MTSCSRTPYTGDNFAQAVLDLTGGQGVDVVFDAVGAAELRPKSLRRAWFGVFNAYSQPAMWACGVANLVPLVASGAVDPYITGVYTREPAPEAHRLLEGRQSQGKLALVHPN